MAVWPSQFCPLLNSLQEAPPNNTIRSSMDVGPQKVRRRTTANIRPISFRMFLKKADLQTLDDFYTTDTYSGSEEFDFIHPRTLQPVKARFVEPPTYTERSGVGYEATVSLEIMP